MEIFANISKLHFSTLISATPTAEAKCKCELEVSKENNFLFSLLLTQQQSSRLFICFSFLCHHHHIKAVTFLCLPNSFFSQVSILVCSTALSFFDTLCCLHLATHFAHFLQTMAVVRLLCTSKIFIFLSGVNKNVFQVTSDFVNLSILSDNFWDPNAACCSLFSFHFSMTRSQTERCSTHDSLMPFNSCCASKDSVVEKSVVAKSLSNVDSLNNKINQHFQKAWQDATHAFDMNSINLVSVDNHFVPCQLAFVVVQWQKNNC